jgi:predicted dehydrogenase
VKQINWGIIGCGDVAERKSGPAFYKAAGSSLVAVMRRNAEKAKDFAFRHKVAKWYNDAYRLIEDPEVTAIYIATPPLNHCEFCIAALKAGKPVYVEKPMSTDVESAKKMMETSEQTGVKLSVAHYRREHPYFKKIKSLLDSDVIGKPILVNLQVFQPVRSAIIGQTEDQWRLNAKVSGGGYFYDLAPHQLDLLIHFFGSGYHASGLSGNLTTVYNVDDATAGSILFDNEVLFTGTWCFSAPPEQAKDHCEIIGTKGRITFSFFDWQPIIVEAGNGREIFNPEALDHVQLPMIEKVSAYFRGEGLNPCSARDGVEVMKLMEIFTKKGI